MPSERRYNGGRAHQRTTYWLGTDDGDEGGMEGYGFAVGTEDNMVSVRSELEDDRGAELEILIMRDLFPKLRKAMDRIDKRFEKKGKATK